MLPTFIILFFLELMLLHFAKGGLPLRHNYSYLDTSDFLQFTDDEDGQRYKKTSRKFNQDPRVRLDSVRAQKDIGKNTN